MSDGGLDHGVSDQDGLPAGEAELRDARASYWDAWYAGRGATGRKLPSQFATFVAGELERPHRVVELGCGDGRDALFFASYGHDVVAVDASASAIEGCRRLADALGERVSFIRSTIDDPDLVAKVRGDAGPRVVYARFFLHAITDHEEETLLDVAAAIGDPGDLLAVEYRTTRDSSGAKVTASHFRRFVLPASFEARALGRGFEVVYAVEGFGFAKYRQDDAYVARTLFRRRAS
jgi:SAM-dependent methyltransferase